MQSPSSGRIVVTYVMRSHQDLRGIPSHLWLKLRYNQQTRSTGADSKIVQFRSHEEGHTEEATRFNGEIGNGEINHA